MNTQQPVQNLLVTMVGPQAVAVQLTTMKTPVMVVAARPLLPLAVA